MNGKELTPEILRTKRLAAVETLREFVHEGDTRGLGTMQISLLLGALSEIKQQLENND